MSRFDTPTIFPLEPGESLFGNDRGFISYGELHTKPWWWLNNHRGLYHSIRAGVDEPPRGAHALLDEFERSHDPRFVTKGPPFDTRLLIPGPGPGPGRTVCHSVYSWATPSPYFSGDALGQPTICPNVGLPMLSKSYSYFGLPQSSTSHRTGIPYAPHKSHLTKSCLFVFPFFFARVFTGLSSIFSRFLALLILPHRLLMQSPPI